MASFLQTGRRAAAAVPAARFLGVWSRSVPVRISPALGKNVTDGVAADASNDEVKVQKTIHTMSLPIPIKDNSSKGDGWQYQPPACVPGTTIPENMFSSYRTDVLLSVQDSLIKIELDHRGQPVLAGQKLTRSPTRGVQFCRCSITVPPSIIERILAVEDRNKHVFTFHTDENVKVDIGMQQGIIVIRIVDKELQSVATIEQGEASSCMMLLRFYWNWYRNPYRLVTGESKDSSQARPSDLATAL